MNDLPSILSALVAALSVDHGTFDLSGDDQVKEGTYPSPPVSRAFASFVPPEQIESVPYGVGPDFYLETYRLELRLWAQVTDSTPGTRAARGRLIDGEVRQTLDTARLGNDDAIIAIWRCVRWRVASAKPDPAAAKALAGWAQARLTIEFQFRRAVGTGA